MAGELEQQLGCGCLPPPDSPFHVFMLFDCYCTSSGYGGVRLENAVYSTSGEALRAKFVICHTFIHYHLKLCDINIKYCDN